MKHRFLTFLLICLPLFAYGETIEERLGWRSELRVGWGDQLFEALAWHEPASVVTGASSDARFKYKEEFEYYQHCFIEYQYRFNRWFGLGVMADLSGVSWDDVIRDGKGEKKEVIEDQYFWNAVLMPTVRFTYFRHPYLNLYSGLGFGLCVNGGTETDAYGNHTVAAPAVNLTLIGVSANYKRYFAAVEFGGMYALSAMEYVYMAKSRMFTASIGVRF